MRWIAISVGMVGAAAICAYLLRPQPMTTLASLSPDESYRVHLVELPTWLDRNFEIRLENMADRSVTTIFRSPDEGRPIGSESFIWSTDSSRFMLLGKHFFVNETAEVANGRALYLMYELQSGAIHCNATQQANPKPFTADDTDDIEWQPIGI